MQPETVCSAEYITVIANKILYGASSIVNKIVDNFVNRMWAKEHLLNNGIKTKCCPRVSAMLLCFTSLWILCGFREL